MGMADLSQKDEMYKACFTPFSVFNKKAADSLLCIASKRRVLNDKEA